MIFWCENFYVLRNTAGQEEEWRETAPIVNSGSNSAAGRLPPFPLATATLTISPLPLNCYLETRMQKTLEIWQDI